MRCLVTFVLNVYIISQNNNSYIKKTLSIFINFKFCTWFSKIRPTFWLSNTRSHEDAAVKCILHPSENDHRGK